MSTIIVPQAQQALWRGELKLAQNKVNQLITYQTSSDNTKLLALRYALWVHQYFLNTPIANINISPQERDLLQKAIILKEKGKLKRAIKLLKNKLPKKSIHKKLFQLRIRALQFVYKRKKMLRKRKKKEAVVDTYSLAYIDATQMNIYAMSPRYKKAIDESIKAGNYPIVAQWIDASLLINPDHKNLITLKAKLVKKAKKWYKLGKEAMQKGQSKRALRFMKASLPFLSAPLQKEASNFIRDL